MRPDSLLGPQDPPSYSVQRAGGRSPFVFTCDHAGNLLPRCLGNLGLSESELSSHIAWDLGIAGLGKKLAQRLDAFLITQNYSRLVIDVNRPLDSPESIVTRSERSFVPGNRALSSEQARARASAIFWPYHQRLSRELDRRLAAGQPSVLVTLHSFTPLFMDVPRPMHAGVLYGRDARLGKAMLAHLRNDASLVIGDNEPYAVSDEGDYTLLVHGEQRNLLHVELEIRQDLIEDEAQQHTWAARLASALTQTTSALFQA
jgi:predicted N-formylglutamate amidohydrolase